MHHRDRYNKYDREYYVRFHDHDASYGMYKVFSLELEICVIHDLTIYYLFISKIYV